MKKGTWKMKVQKRLAKSIVLFCISLLVLVSLPILAVADEQKSGNMQIKTDRIMKGQNENTDFRETELERVFPTLFTDETKETIVEKDLENERMVEDLGQSIFFIDREVTSTVEDVKDDLFSEEYTAVASSGNHVQEEASSGGGLSNTLMVVFAGMGILLFGGLYVAMRSLLD